jgi:hypothetical protein
VTAKPLGGKPQQARLASSGLWLVHRMLDTLDLKEAKKLLQAGVRVAAAIIRGKSGGLTWRQMEVFGQSERMEPTLDPAPKRRPLSGNEQGDDSNSVVLELDAHHDIAPTAFLRSTERVV